MNRKALTALLATLAVAGCTLAPDYQQPASPVPATAGDNQRIAEELVLPGWEALFQDPQLQQLIRTALSNNRDLRLALLDVAEARAQYRIEGAALYPELSVDGEGSRQRLPADLSQTGDSEIQTQYSVGLGVAAYEVDLFGRLRSLKQSALQQYLATEEARRSAHITLVSEVANAYLTLQADRRNLRISRETVEAQQESVDLVKGRFDLGLASELEVRQAEVALETARASQARFKRLVAQDRNALAVLVGAPLPPLPDSPAEDLDTELAALPEIPAGVPSSVLRQRPDIQQAEYSLKAANANIGAARAAFFPTISLTGNAGFSSNDLDNLFSSDGLSWSFGPSISLPIFDWGAREADLDLAKAREVEQVAVYEKTVQEAFREVSDALAGRRWLAEQVAALTQGVAAQERITRLARLRYREGVADYLEVLDAERNLFTAQQQLLTTQRAFLQNGTSLFVALGGGLAVETPS